MVPSRPTNERRCSHISVRPSMLASSTGAGEAGSGVLPFTDGLIGFYSRLIVYVCPVLRRHQLLLPP